MFTYNIGFFISNTAYKEEKLTNEIRFDSHNYQNIIVRAHESAKHISNLSEKRVNILEFLHNEYGFISQIKGGK